jgi:hypothetical protein
MKKWIVALGACVALATTPMSVLANGYDAGNAALGGFPVYVAPAPVVVEPYYAPAPVVVEPYSAPVVIYGARSPYYNWHGRHNPYYHRHHHHDRD